MPLIEKPNRAEILAEKDRKRREEELNTRNWSGLEVYRFKNGGFDFEMESDGDWYVTRYLTEEQAKELIEFMQEGYQKVPRL